MFKTFLLPAQYQNEQNKLIKSKLKGYFGLWLTSNINFLPNRWTFKFRESRGLKPNKMLYKLLSHVDFNREIMPRKLMEPAPGTATLVTYPPLCTSNQKHMSAKWAFANQSVRSNHQVVWQACSVLVTFILKGNLPYMPAKTVPWKGGKSDMGRNVYFCGEYSPGGAAVCVSKGPLESGSIWGSLGERTTLFGSGGLFVCCLRVSPEYVVRRLLIVWW